MDFKGSKTEKNVLAAFAGESQARNRYTYFASVAKKEGFIQVSNFFLETAENEKEHAKVFFQYLQGSEVTIEAAYPAGVIGNTRANLSASASGEKFEWSTLYKGFAATAEKEGFKEIAASFINISVAEKQHEKRYSELLNNIEQNSVFKKAKTVTWRCSNCGYIYKGNEAPEQCPACRHPKAYYEILCENW